MDESRIWAYNGVDDGQKNPRDPDTMMSSLSLHLPRMLPTLGRFFAWVRPIVLASATSVLLAACQSPSPQSSPPPDAAQASTGPVQPPPEPGKEADDPGQLDAQVKINTFPAPVPPPSAETPPLSLKFVAGQGKHPITFGDVEDSLSDLINAAGYDWRQFYDYPGGFAMVTRVEQTRPDWTPMPSPARWAVNVGSIKSWSIGEVIRRFASAPSGYYQVIVFVVTDQPVITASQQATYADLTSKLPPGADRLPQGISSRIASKETKCTVLIYEFKKADGQDAAVIVPGSLDARDHLERTALWAGLAGAQ